MKNLMNDKKLVFIICSNNQLYYEECVWYIHNLHLPDGYEMDIICITEAESMAQAYNAAMESSDAKYKIYLHQDVFIYHRQFIEDILKIFQENPEIGLIGMVGGVNLPDDAVIWSGWNVGCSWGCDYANAFPVIGYNNPVREYTEVEAVDGMLMATQYDIRWREDLNLGWNFYDVSQSLEFTKKGYKAVVPFQRRPWCMHDCGRSKLLHYDEARSKVMKEYKERFKAEFVPQCNMESILDQEKKGGAIRECFERGGLEQALEIGNSVRHEDIKDNDLQYALNFLEIYSAERNLSGEAESFFEDVCTWNETKDKYDRIKFAIRHAENDTNEELVNQLLYLIRSKKISEEAIGIIIIHSAVSKENAVRRLLYREQEKSDNHEKGQL